MTTNSQIAFMDVHKDAGLLREYIGEHFAGYWIGGHGIPLDAANRLHRLVKRLSGLAGLPVAEVWRQLGEDADNRF